MTFAHLNVRSKASMLYGSADIKDLVQRAKELGQPAVALTDYSNLYNAIHFYREAVGAGVKPIIGVDLFFCEDAEQQKIQRVRQVSHIVLLAENDIGLKNIARLVSASNSEEFYYYNPRVDFKLLERYNEGVICLTGSSLDGLVSSSLYDKTGSDGEVMEPAALFKAEGIVRRLLKIFDANHLFLEVQDTHLPQQETINGRLRTIAKKYGLRTVATNNVHYVEPHDAEAHKTLLEIGAGQFNRSTMTVFAPEEYYLKSRQDMEQLGLLPEELDATLEIAARCNINIDLKKRRLPLYEFVPEGTTASEYLRKLSNDGMLALGINPSAGDGFETYQQRLDRELTDIEEMGFVDYFLIVHDVVSWVRKQGVLLGRGRGSAGGSLVSYALGVTEIDPLEYGLIWERFLNKGRGGLPDIDTDVPRSYRQKVLEYIRTRFGVGNVAQLVTLGGLQAKAILKEVFKVYGMPFDEANKITALVPAKNDEHVPITLQEAIDAVPELKAYYDKYTPWFKVALALEGCYKSTGIHAAAVVISDIPFDESPYPLTRSKDGDLIFGWDMNTVDSLSLLKLDILGLTTLDDIQVTMDLVKERRGIELSRATIPLDDPATWAMIGQGFTVGIFQIEKQLGRTWSKNLQPESIEQLSDLVSLIRPGPMECLHGDTKILIDTKFGNEYKTIGQLFNEGLRIALGDKRYSNKIVCVDNDHKFVKGKIAKVVKSGKKKLYRVNVTQRLEGDYSEDTNTQATHLNILATKNHRFFTQHGWLRLGDITPGTYIAVMNFRCGRSSRGNKHAQGWKNFRNVAFNHYVYKCLFCDWHDGSLDVNHIVGNRLTDNRPSNLCFLCPNHHRMYSEGKISSFDIKKEQDNHRLPFTEDVIYVRFDGIEFVEENETYDIVIDGDYHNFVAGGFVVHNSDMHTAYRAVKMKGESPAYIHDKLEPIMGRTFSALLYQEQVIDICKQLAGMSLIDADKVRKAMGKKKPEEMKKWKEQFVNGCSAKGIEVVTAEELWGYIEKFAGYGFNKSHGVGYALLAYETAYLKANYTVEFLCAKLRHSDSHPDKFEQMSALVYDGKLFDIEIVPPRLKYGNKDFAVINDKQIAFGLSALKGVGRTAVTDLVKITKDTVTFDELIWRVLTTSTKINSAVMLALIRGGAFDDQEEHRVECQRRFKLLEALTAKERELVQSLMTHQDGKPDWVRIVRALSDESKAEIIKERYGVKVPNVRRRESLRALMAEFDASEIFDSKAQRIAWEQFYLGISLSGSEADIYRAKDRCIDLVRNGEADTMFEIAVCVDAVRQITTKKGDPMAFVTARDKTYVMDNIVVFPKTFEKAKHLLEEGSVLKIKGKVDDRGSLIADRVERLQ